MAHQRSFAQPALPSWVAKAAGWGLFLILLLVVGTCLSPTFGTRSSVSWQPPPPPSTPPLIEVVRNGDAPEPRLGENTYIFHPQVTSGCIQAAPGKQLRVDLLVPEEWVRLGLVILKKQCTVAGGIIVPSTSRGGDGITYSFAIVNTLHEPVQAIVTSW